MALFQLMNSQRNSMQEFTYSAFKQQLAAGNVKNVVVYDGKQLEGEFVSQVPQDGRKAKNFTVLLPIKDSESLLKELEQVSAAPSPGQPGAR